MIPIECLKEAKRGRDVLVVGDFQYTFSAIIGGEGMLYIRDFRLLSLRSVAVDMVYLIGDMPDDVAALAMCLVRESGRFGGSDDV